MNPRDELIASLNAATGAKWLRHIVETLPLAVYIDAADEHATGLWISPRVEAMFGYPAASWLGDTDFFESIVYPDDRGHAIGMMATAFRDGSEGWTGEYRIIAADGRTVWVRDDAIVVKDAAGKADYVQGFLIDVTAQHDALAASARQHDAELRYRRLVEELPLVVYLDLPDAAATNVYTSPSVESMTGYTPEAWRDLSFYESVLHPDDRERVEAQAYEELDDGHDSWTGEYRIVAADGRTLWIRDESWMLKDAEGRPEFVQGVMIDITENTLANAEIRRQKQHFESLVEISPAAIVTMDNSEIVTGWNPAATQLFGYAADEAVGRHIDDLVLTSGELRAEGASNTQAALESGQVNRQTRRARNDGTLVDVEMVMVPLDVDGERSGFYVIYRDISERLRGERVQSALQRIAEAASAALDMREFYVTIQGIVTELVGVENFYIALHDAGRNLINFAYYVDEVDPDVPDPDLWESMGEGLGSGLTAYVLRTGKPLLASNETFKSMIAAGEVAAVGIDSVDWMGVPLRAGGETLGVLAVQTYSEAVRFNEEQLDLLAYVGQHVATALQRARLADETGRRVTVLATVNSLGEALARHLEVDALIELVGERMQETFSADLVYVALYDAAAEEIAFPYYNEQGQRKEHEPFTLGDGPTSRIVRSGKPLRIDSAPGYEEVGKRRLGTTTGSYLGVPIIAGRETIGVLGLQDTTRDRRFGDADASLLATIATNVGVAIQNARLLQEHREAELRYRTLLEAIPMAMYRSHKDEPSGSEYMSERAVAMFGYPKEAWSDPAFFEGILHPDDREWVLAENALDLLDDDSTWVSEYRLIAADGRTVWVRDESWTVRDAEGAAQFQQGCMIDVSEQKQAEAELAAALESLRTTEEASRRLVEELPMAVYTDKPDTTATSTYISPRVETMFGYPREAWMEEPFFASVLHPDDYDRVIGHATTALSGTDERGTTEYRIIAADGSIVWVRDDQWIVRDESGTPLHLQGFLIDITAEHEAALEIRRQKQYFESLVEVSPVAVVVTDLDERIAAWNPAAARLFGYEAGEAIGRAIDEVVQGSDEAPEEEGRDLARDAQPTGRTKRITQRTRKDGSLVEVEMLRVPLVIDGEESGHYVIYHDVTDLQRARREAELATQAKSAFLATMSHEIRTPMNAIIGMSGLLLDTDMSEEQQEFAETIQTSGDALLTIINDILDFSKIEAGHVELESQPFSLSGCVEAALDVLAPAASEKHIELAYSLAPGLPATIVGDAGRLRQIVLNLLSNAVKFTSEGEVVLAVHGRRVDNGGDPAALGRWEIAVDVRDTGIGIPPDRVGDLFQSFSQADASISRRFGGTGLGLVISRRLAEAMGGSITAQSSGVPGEGSLFHLTIQAEAAPDLGSAALAAVPLVELDGKRVLVVDDNATNRRILLAQMSGWGMQASETGSPVEALELIRRGESYDLLLLDFLMPELDGLQLVRAIEELGLKHPIPVVLLTSVGLSSRDLTSVAAYLTKPAKPSALHDTILSVLAGGRTIVRPKAARPAMDGDMGTRLPLKILVAEDNAVNQKLIVRLLERHGYAADVVENGMQAVAAVENADYDLVLMDVQMPEMDGLEATRRIVASRPRGRAPRIAALTANAMAEDRAMCMAAGMDDYLSKPIRPDELTAALERAAAARRVN